MAKASKMGKRRVAKKTSTFAMGTKILLSQLMSTAELTEDSFQGQSLTERTMPDLPLPRLVLFRLLQYKERNRVSSNVRVIV